MPTSTRLLLIQNIDTFEVEVPEHQMSNTQYEAGEMINITLEVVAEEVFVNRWLNHLIVNGQKTDFSRPWTDSSLGYMPLVNTMPFYSVL